ncbi:MAG: ATP-binding cassette domain-containing protein [Fluviicola sp.]|nr:ATP-binding cassette domain-containing protein [Fluviicola sp.]
MSFWKNNILSSTYRSIKTKLSDNSLKKVKRLFPITFFSNIIELLGVFLLFPIIQLMLKPNLFEEGSIFKDFFASIGIQTQENAILLSFSFVFLFFLFKNGIVYLVTKRTAKLQYQIATEIVLDSFEKHLDENHTFFSKNNNAILLRNIRQIPYEFVTFVLLPFITIINEIVILTIALGVILYYSPILFFSMLVFSLPTLYLYTRFHKKKLTEISEKKDKYGGEQYRIAMQALESFVEIKVFQSKKFFIPKFKASSEYFEETLKDSAVLNTFSPKITETVAIGSILLIVIVGAIFKIEPETLSSFLILFVVGSFRILPSLNKITLSLNYMKGNKHVIDLLPDHEKKKKTNIKQSELIFKKAIQFNNLSFKYNTTNQNVFSEIDFKIDKGARIGIIGESGAGKTTFLALLLRFYKETTGNISIDDTKLSESNLASWYNLISYVPQSVRLIDGDIAQNIAFGVEDNEIDYDKIERIINQVHLKSFVDALPLGVKNTLGENNTDISGGQKQRIGLARALYHGGEILILDEATSALDQDTERNIMEEINALKNYTVIFVTHRKSALEKFDKVYEIKNGQFIEQ